MIYFLVMKLIVNYFNIFRFSFMIDSCSLSPTSCNLRWKSWKSSFLNFCIVWRHQGNLCNSSISFFILQCFQWCPRYKLIILWSVVRVGSVVGISGEQADKKNRKDATSQPVCNQSRPCQCPSVFFKSRGCQTVHSLDKPEFLRCRVRCVPTL